ncbi:MAG: type II toxin-antitoxin system Phd/YefM family antitoxin [Planctomycetes bacterium]|nr:type II toxin-antitoxin system Phd/YefM family antitoxin [Planctomycetota bacterium]
MTERVSTIDVRQRIGDLLNRVALRNDEFIIERKGKPLAALVSVERLAQMRRFARRQGLEFLKRQEKGPLDDAGAMELALEAQRWARRRARRPRPRAK